MADEKKEEKLDSPLVVHKVTDASYQDTANNIDVDITHIEEESATLERHRFRKEKKSSKLPIYIVFAVVIIAVACYLFFSGVIGGTDKSKITVPADSGSVTEANKFENTITVKGTYIFFEGKEVDGIEGLTSEIKYLDAGTVFTVQDENADDTFLSEELLPLLDEYGIKYEVDFIVSSGLKSQYETESVQ